MEEQSDVDSIIERLESMPRAIRPEYTVEAIQGGGRIVVITKSAPSSICLAFGHDVEFRMPQYGDDSPPTGECQRCGETITWPG